jgi:WD40 repeat protein
MTATKVKLGAALFLVLGVVAAGTGAVFSGLTTAAAPANSKIAIRGASSPPEEPAKVNEAKGDASQRADLHGIPLPPEATARMGRARFSAGGTGVNNSTLTFTPDGKHVALAGADRSVIVWDAATGKETARVGRAELPVPVQRNFALSPDGKLVAIMENEGIQIWDMKANKKIGDLADKAAGYLAYAVFSPDGKTLVATGGNVIHRWDAVTWKKLPSCEGHTGMILTLAFSADSKRIVSGADDQTVHLWDATTGKSLRTVLKHRDQVVAVAVSPDGKRVASRGNDSAIRVWDAETEEDVRSWTYPTRIANPGTGNAIFLRFGADGKTLVVGDTAIPPALLEPTSAPSANHGIVILDISSGDQVRRFAWPADSNSPAVLSPDGKLVATIGYWQPLGIWDAASGKELSRQAGHDGPVEAVAFAPDGKTLATGGRDRSIRLWDAATGAELKKLNGHSGPVTQLCFSRDGKHLASASGDLSNLNFYNPWSDRNVSWWDVASGKEIRQFPGHTYGVQSLGLSPDGKRLAVIATGGGRLVWDTETGKKIRQEARANTKARPVCTPDGKSVAFVDEKGLLRIWDTTSKDDDAIRELFVEEKTLRGAPVAISTDGRFLFTVQGGSITAREGSRMQLWDVESEKLLRSHVTTEGPDFPAAPFVGAFSPDSKTLAVAYRGGAVALIELATWQERYRFKGGQTAITSLVFSPDGSMLVSGSVDGTVLVWDVKSAGGQAPKSDLTAKQLDEFWADLGSADPVKGYRAERALATSLKQAVPFLRKQVPPTAEIEKKRVERLIADLGVDEFAVRKKAEEELAKLGSLAKPAMKKALEGKPSLDVAQRLNTLVKALEDRQLTPDDLRLSRAIEALEAVGSDGEANKLLEEWAKGAPGALLTEDAKAALARIAGR